MDEWLARLRQLQGMEGVRLRSINAVRVLRGLLAAVVGLHRLGLAHMDIKPANVVLWFEGEWVVRVALIDFGACRLVASWCPLGSPVHAMGTYDFAAPETFSSTHARPSFACDAFSVGAVMYELVHGQPLIRLGDMEWGAVAARWRRWQEDQEELGVRGAWEFPPLSGGFSKEMVGVVRRLLVEDPARRVSLERLYAEFEPEGRLLEPLSPPRVLDPPLPASGGDWGLRRAGLAFLSLVCPSPMAFPLAANIYARYRGGVWSQPSRGEARVVRAAACLAQVVKFPDSRVTDAYAGEVGALVDAFGTGGCLSDTAERVLALSHGVHTPDCELLWRAVAGAHGAREQAALYM